MTSAEHARAERRAAIPNALTVARLILAAALFAALSVYRFPEGPVWLLPLSAAIFIVAAATDALDGYLARRWDVITTFGRVMDPVADKVLVLGTFILLAGPGFATDTGAPITGLASWMVVVILARELLVTSLRSVLEARGVSFGASAAGKAKMAAQSAAAPAILLVLFAAPEPALRDGWGRTTLDVIAIGMVAITVISGVPYVTRAAAVMKSSQ